MRGENNRGTLMVEAAVDSGTVCRYKDCLASRKRRSISGI